MKQLKINGLNSLLVNTKAVKTFNEQDIIPGGAHIDSSEFYWYSLYKEDNWDVRLHIPELYKDLLTVTYTNATYHLKPGVYYVGASVKVRDGYYLNGQNGITLELQYECVVKNEYPKQYGYVALDEHYDDAYPFTYLNEQYNIIDENGVFKYSKEFNDWLTLKLNYTSTTENSLYISIPQYVTKIEENALNCQFREVYINDNNGPIILEDNFYNSPYTLGLGYSYINYSLLITSKNNYNTAINQPIVGGEDGYDYTHGTAFSTYHYVMAGNQVVWDNDSMIVANTNHSSCTINKIQKTLSIKVGVWDDNSQAYKYYNRTVGPDTNGKITDNGLSCALTGDKYNTDNTIVYSYDGLIFRKRDVGTSSQPNTGAQLIYKEA